MQKVSSPNMAATKSHHWGEHRSSSLGLGLDSVLPFVKFLLSLAYMLYVSMISDFFICDPIHVKKM